MATPPPLPQRNDVICTDVNTEGRFETMTYGEAMRAASRYGEVQLYEQGYDYPGGMRDVVQYFRTDFESDRVVPERIRGPITFTRGMCTSGLRLPAPTVPGRIPGFTPPAIFPPSGRTTPEETRVGDPVSDVEVPRQRTNYPLWVAIVALGAGLLSPLTTLIKKD